MDAAGCSSAARSRTRRRPRPRWESGGPPTVQPCFGELARSPDPSATWVCGCSRSRPSMPRIRGGRGGPWPARGPAYPPPMRRCGWLSVGWRSRLRWTPPPRRCSYRRWPCCSRTGPEEVVAKAARKATFRLAGLGPGAPERRPRRVSPPRGVEQLDEVALALVGGTHRRQVGGELLLPAEAGHDLAHLAEQPDSLLVGLLAHLGGQPHPQGLGATALGGFLPGGLVVALPEEDPHQLRAAPRPPRPDPPPGTGVRPAIGRL